MEIICIESEAFYALLDEVVARLREKDNIEEKWIDTETVMRMTGIKSKTTLQKLRNEGQIRYTQPQKNIILYDRESVLKYLETHVREIIQP